MVQQASDFDIPASELKVLEAINSRETLFAAEAIIRHSHNLDVPDEGIRRYFGRWWHLHYQHPIILLVAHGKLTQDNDEDWSNVLAHCAMQYAAMAEVMDTLVHHLCGTSSSNYATRQFGQEWPRDARRAACIHDWTKRRDRKPGDFTPEEIAAGDEMYKDTTSEGMRKLIAATGPDFLGRVLQGRASIWELISFYVDDICRGGEIVPLLERIAEVEARRRDLNDDSDLTARLSGRKYWDVEREIGRMAEQFIFFTLGGVENLGISSPEELPNWIRARVEERIRKCATTMR